MTITTNELITAFGILFGILLSIISWFIVDYLGKLNKSIESLDTREFTNHEKLSKQVSEGVSFLNTRTHEISTNVSVVNVGVNHIQKKVEYVDKISDSVSNIHGKVLVLETKVENLGTVKVKDK